MTTTEEWRPCFDGYYEVSSVGRVRRAKRASATRPGFVLKPRIGLSPYLTVSLKARPRQVTAYVHRLVAEAFLGPCPEGYQVNHKNGIKTDNTPDNLEYLTPSDNRKHAYRTGLQQRLFGERSHRAKLTDEKVRQIRERRAKGEPLAVLAKEFGVGEPCISMACNRVKWAHVP